MKDLGPTGKDVTYGAGRINCSLAVACTPFPGPSHDLALSTMIAPGAKVDPGNRPGAQSPAGQCRHLSRNQHSGALHD